MDNSFDPELGWVRRPNTSGVEQGANGEVRFHIDARGNRLGSRADLPASIATFGDSYVFCRQVADGETWQSVLSDSMKVGVLNYGVGNYGVDQALLRYEREVLPASTKLVVMGFVPETICRVQSCWKHYLEFGNTLAFKPRFAFEANGRLQLLDNPIKQGSNFKNLEVLLPSVRQNDRFYEERFRNLQFRFSYLLSFMRNPARHTRVIGAVCVRWGARLLGVKSPWLENLPFSLIMRDNIRFSHRLYGEKASTDLLSAILMRFKSKAESRGQIPLVVLMPQLLDLKLASNGHLPYVDFFRDLSAQVNVLDLSESLLGMPLDKLYINDQYGGHFSAHGNEIVGREIQAWIRTNAKQILASGGE